MRESGYYPEGAEFDSSAPYNEKEFPKKELEVTINLTLSKKVTIEVDDIGNNDSDDISVYNAVYDGIVFPQNLAAFTENIFDYDLALKEVGMPMHLKDAINDCKDWLVDDCEIIYK